MATSELERPEISPGYTPYWEAPTEHSAARLFSMGFLEPLASLRLTVVLFAASIFLIFMGTLAQKDHDVWEVVNDTYFRTWIASIEFVAFERLAQIFFKQIEWNLSGSFPFFGGKLIGLALLVNLVAAHSVRFKVAAHGKRLAIGWATFAVGIAVTYAAIQSGMNQAVESELSPKFCDLLWQFFRGTLAAGAIGGAYYMVAFGSRVKLRLVEWRMLGALVVLLAALAAWLLANPEVRLDNSGIRILWQLVKGTAAGVVLLVGCVMVFHKRAGIVLLHGGVGLLMLSELVTAVSVDESSMTIAEGGTAHFSTDFRTAELAVIDRSNAEHDQVTVVPASLLESNVGEDRPIAHDALPFTVRVHRWLPNAELRSPRAGESNPATAGFGLQVVADKAKERTGVGEDAEKSDAPAAYFELFSKTTGKSLGTYLGASGLEHGEQPVAVDGRTYDFDLRFKRIYHPFSVTLKDFRFDRYMGTNTAKNFSSLVEFKDPQHNIDREVLIWMNNPLRYAGTTLYQSSFDAQTEQSTVLQVVSNPSWMTPYVACMLVAAGMLAHFGTMLVRFLQRRAEEAGRAGTAARPNESRVGADHQSRADAKRNGSALVGDAHPSTPGVATLAKWMPAIVLLVFALYIAGKARMPESKPSEMRIYDFGKLPLVYEGRVKPYDTLARNSLQILSGRQEVGVIDKKGKVTSRLPAIRWLLDAISGADAADDHRVFRIEDLDLVDTLGLKHRPLFWRYSLNEIHKKDGELDRQVKLAEETPEKERSLYHSKVLQLASKRNFYTILVLSFRPAPLIFERDRFEKSLEQTRYIISRLQQAQPPHAVPPSEADSQWEMLIEAELEVLRDRASQQPVNMATIQLRSLLTAYALGDVASFNQKLADYSSAVAKAATLMDSGSVAKSERLSEPRLNFEVFFNQFSPFYYAAVLYLFAFILGVLSWVMWTEPLRRSSIWLLWFTFALHTFAIVARIYISGRPPITNLYSTAIFIGWAGVLKTLVFEHIYRLGLGNIAASVMGFLTLLVAYNLSLDGDTFIVLQAVLDTQFWLATHVVTINLGYAATFTAGVWGAKYLLLAHLFPVLDEEARHKLLRILYGTLCFAIFSSFIGTVLGGLWADDSWGRFWGWDPKENGALMIVLWNALVLHARWGGLVKGRGLATLAVAGNIVTTWSYFGVNELGVGLHAYGASEKNTGMWLLIFAASQLALIILGVCPRRWFAANEPQIAVR